MAEVASSGRQPNAGTISHASAAATIVPTAQNPSSTTRYRPRLRRGRYSANSEKSSGSAPPRPKPVSARRIPSVSASGEKAERNPKTAKMRTVSWNPARRPIRSEIAPQNQAPASMPRNVDVAMSPASVDERANSSRTAGSAKPISKTSAASAAHVTPHTASRRCWNDPIPTASIASSTLNGVILLCAVSILGSRPNGVASHSSSPPAVVRPLVAGAASGFPRTA